LVYIPVAIFWIHVQGQVTIIAENYFDLIDFWCFNATFSNISAISWRSVLLVEETEVPEENH
jgi:hypothetical protein